MNANKPEIKLSHRILNYIAQLERLTGILQRGNNSSRFGEKTDANIQTEALSALCLDHTTPAPLTHPLLTFFTSNTNSGFNSSSIISKDHLEIIQRTKNAFLTDFELSEEGLLKLNQLLVGKTKNSSDTQSLDDCLRTYQLSFLNHENKRLFTTVSPFLVKRRLRELVEWACEELSYGEMSPILTIGTFHLLLLQIHPFKDGNHRTALIATWSLLRDCGYNFVEHGHFIKAFLDNSEGYHNSLKHAERTIFSDWSGTPLWIEFFVRTLLKCAEDAVSIEERYTNQAVLTNTQKQILEVIQKHGAVTREKVVTETGINLSTVKYNLSLLKERGHLRREGGGRSTFYTIL